MKQIISFDKLKLTNNQLDENGHVSSVGVFSTCNWLNNSSGLSCRSLHTDYLEFHAPLSAQIPHCLFAIEKSVAHQRRSQWPAQSVSTLHFHRDVVYRRDGIPKPTSKYLNSGGDSNWFAIAWSAMCRCVFGIWIRLMRLHIFGTFWDNKNKYFFISLAFGGAQSASQSHGFRHPQLYMVCRLVKCLFLSVRQRFQLFLLENACGKIVEYFSIFLFPLCVTLLRETKCSWIYLIIFCDQSNCCSFFCFSCF